MRIPPRFKSTLAAAAGVGLLVAMAPARADTQVNLASCSSWSIVGGTFTCTTANNNNNNNNTAPSGCSVSASASSVAPGGAVSIFGSCTGAAATNWSWTGGFMAGSNLSQGGGTLSSTTTFTGTPSNSVGSGAPVSVTVAVDAGGGNSGGGNTAGGISCAGFANTRIVNLNWNSPGNDRQLSSSAGGFGNNDALVAVFTTGGNVNNSAAVITVAEYVDAPTERIGVLSDKPCDFGPQASFGATSGPATTVSITYSVGAGGFYTVGLKPNTTYYLNVKNANRRGTSSCAPGASCNVFVELGKPG